MPHVKASVSQLPKIRLPISDVSLASDDIVKGIKISGRVENNENDSFSMIYVVAHVFNKNGELIARPMTILNNTIEPGDKYGFTAVEVGSSPDVTLENIDSYELYAFPLQNYLFVVS